MEMIYKFVSDNTFWTHLGLEEKLLEITHGVKETQNHISQHTQSYFLSNISLRVRMVPLETSELFIVLSKVFHPYPYHSM